MQSFKKMLGKTLRKAFYRHRCIRTERLMVTISRKDRDTLMTSFTSTGVKWEKITLRKGNAILFDKCSIYWYALTYSQNFDLHKDLRPYVNSISAARGVGKCPTPWFFLYVFLILYVIVLKLLVANLHLFGSKRHEL